MRIDNEAEQLSIYDLDLWCGRMFQEPSPAEPQKERISGSSLRRSSELKSVVFQSLDLTPGAGNLLGEFYWELISPWRGDASTLNTGVSPREEKESSLSQILQDDPPDKYYLTRKACLGILRRASERGKELPRKLNQALEIQSGVAPPTDTVHNQQPPHASQQDSCTEGFDGYNGDLTGAVAATLGVNCGMSTGRNGLIQPIAFAANQRDEVRDLHDVAGALGAQPGMKQQTFIAEGVVAKGNGDCFLTPERHTSLSAGGGQAGQGYPCVLTAGFSAGAGASAGSIGYGEELPAIRRLLEQDSKHLDRIQVLMASSREFYIIIRLRSEKETDVFPYLSRIEQSINDNGFTTRRATEQDLKRMLGVYFEQNVTTEKFEDYDGDRWVIVGE